jgi:hypothetical protein
MGDELLDAVGLSCGVRRASDVSGLRGSRTSTGLRWGLDVLRVCGLFGTMACRPWSDDAIVRHD